MALMPMVTAFIIALVGALAVGFRPGFPFGALLLGAAILAALTGVTASVLQFLPQRYFIAAAILGGGVLGLLVNPMLGAAQTLGFGDVRHAMGFVWPVAAVAALLWSRATGMRLPTLRRRRTLSR